MVGRMPWHGAVAVLNPSCTMYPSRSEHCFSPSDWAGHQGFRRPRWSAVACAAALLAACGGGGSSSPGAGFRAEIRRTAHGIPHIEATNEKGLGYGVGYAYAQDNFCLLAEHFTTVRGERARFFGEGAQPGADAGSLPSNVSSDFFYRLHNEDGRLRDAWRAYSPAVQDLFKGFAAGYNRYLRETGAARLPGECRAQPWVRAIDELDLVRLMRDYAALNGLSDLAPFIAGAEPPKAGNAATAMPHAQAGAALHAVLRATPRTGSNGIALGSDATDNGRGMVLGNPHFPWFGALRMYQLHVTIPGRMDVMGATLPGLPVVGIGFTRQFAWTHTTNTAARLTFYQLRLDPKDPTRYLLDGQSRAMERKTLRIEVRRADGRLEMRSRDVYGSEFGTVLALGKALPWDRQYAYAVRDTNSDNHRLADQWLAMNRASSLDEMKASVLRIVGNPWNNTIAADAEGRTVFMSATPTPHLTQAQMDACRPDQADAFAGAPAPVLRGDTARCQWLSDPSAPQPGIIAGPSLPLLERRDYVQNSNDSAWLTNPAAPLTGFPPVASVPGTAQGLRTRQGLEWLEQSLQRQNGKPTRRIALDQLQDMVLDNRVHLAGLVLDDLLALCPGGAQAGGSPSAALVQACAALAAWDRTAGLGAGIGYGYLEAFALDFLAAEPEVWRVPFDPSDPVHTPRGLRVELPHVAAQVRAALEKAVASVAASGWKPGQRWGDIQGVTRGTRRIPVPGGDEALGIYNMVLSRSTEGQGRREVLFGTSYLQAVGFTAEGPRARALLAYSQSTNPDSPHYADQTERFSKRDWVELPFTRAQIDAQAVGARQVISE